MRLSISNIAWEKEQDVFYYEQMRKFGYAGVEIAPTRVFSENPYGQKEEAVRWSKWLQNEYGLSVSSVQSIWFGRTERLFGNKCERAALFFYTKRAIDFASVLGCHNLVFGSPKNRSIKQGEENRIAESFFFELGEYAATKNTVLSLEANPAIYQTNYLITTAETLALVKKINSKGIRVNLDLGTIIYNHEVLSEIEKEWEWINHIHISEPHLKAVHIRGIHRQLAALLMKDRSYDGYISVEMGKGLADSVIIEIMREIGELYGKI